MPSDYQHDTPFLINKHVLTADNQAFMYVQKCHAAMNMNTCHVEQIG
ncbi:MAG: hypothetical protein JWR67_3276 [Mucilaginibacter sp.]|nr:hypothetical protein [Mucilaginibacter sp.]